MEKGKIAAYIRVSRTTQDFERQIHDLKMEAKHRGFHIEDDDIYAEKITGFSKGDERKEMNRLLERIRTGEKDYSTVYCTEISRIARRPKWGRQILEELTEHKVALFFPTIGMPSIEKNGTPNRMFNIIFNILLEFAEQEVEQTIARSKSGKKQRARMGGGASGVFLPYGYCNNEERILVIDEDEAEVVRDIFHYALQGFGNQSIANILNERGIPTKKQRVFAGREIHYPTGTMHVDAIQWTTPTVYGILTNSIYCGKRVFKDEVVKAPAIVSEETWNEVQDGLKERNNNPNRGKAYLYLLKRKLKCGCCGKNYCAKFRPGKEMYYQCIANKNRNTCPNCGINILAVESVVWDVLKHSAPLFQHLKESTTHKELMVKIDGLKTLVTHQEKVLQEKEQEKERVMNLYMKGRITEEQMDNQFDRIERSMKTANQVIYKLKKEIKAKVESLEKMNSMETMTAKIFSIHDDRYRMKEVFDAVIDKVVVTSVNQSINNNEYLLTIFMHTLEPPVTVLLCTKPRHIPKDDFIDPELQVVTNNHSVIYYRGDKYINEKVKYDGCILQNDVRGVVKELIWLKQWDGKRHKLEQASCIVPFLLPKEGMSLPPQPKSKV